MTVPVDQQRLIASNWRTANWKRWSLYLSERQLGTA